MDIDENEVVADMLQIETSGLFRLAVRLMQEAAGSQM